MDGPAPEETPQGGSRRRWYHALGAVVFIFFCFELGVFLLLFPWMDLWERNYFASLTPAWTGVWMNPYLRGAVSGLGLINIGISISELLRLRRFWRRQSDRGS